MPIQISLKKSTANPTSSSGLTLGEPVFNYGNNTLWMGLGGTTTPAWIGAGVCGASGGIAAGITYQIPTLGAVKDYFSGISGSFAILGSNTFTGLNSFNAGVSSAGGTFSALTRFPSGISASTLRVSSGATFNGDVSIGSDNINYSGSNELFVNAPNKGIWIGDGNGASNGTYLYVSDNAQQVVLNAPNYFSVTAPTAFASPDQNAYVSVLLYTQPNAIQDVMQITDPLDPSANGTKLRILPNGNLFIRGLVEGIGGVSASGGITFNGIVNGVTASFSRLVSFTQGISSAGGTFSALTRFTAGISASGGVTFSGTVASDTGYRVTSSAINAQTGTAYTLVSGDNGEIITFNNASGITLTIPSGLPVGFNCTLIQLGAGQVGITGASGVTLNSYASAFKISGQHGAAGVISYSSNVYNISGTLSV